jgi:hypothetical protein
LHEGVVPLPSADPNTFKMVNSYEVEAEDKSNKYRNGEIVKGR